MNKRTPLINLLLLTFLLLQVQTNTSCSDTQGPAEQSAVAGRMAESATETYGGLRLTVVSIERTKEREVLPNFPEKMKAARGYEFVIVHLKVKALEADKKLDVSHLQLLDVTGGKHKCVFEATDLCDPRLGEEATCDLPFAVPEGARLAKLQTGDVFIDLEKIEKNN
jgi:hypothetical protein